MEQAQANYYLKAHCAWLKHCATVVKPCAKSLNEVVAYLVENYDVEPMSHEETEKMEATFLQKIEGSRYSDLSNSNINSLDLKESDLLFTVTALHDSKEALNCFEKVNRETLDLKGYKIPATEHNQKRFNKYTSHHHSNINQLYKNNDCGYFFWEESLQFFSSEGYGALEILNDLHIYYGVTKDDIQNLTNRFSQYVQLFPHSGYSLSLNNFLNDMEMCQKYGFFNNQRLFTEMLYDNQIQFEFFGEQVAERFKKKWYERFVPQDLHKYADQHYYFSKDEFSGYLWHIFSYGDLDCIKEQQAISSFDSQLKDECIIFFTNENYAFKIKNASDLKSELLNEFSEIFITHIRFTWTYIQTHEPDCGPYFYKKGVEFEKELIKGMIKHPRMYTGTYRLDYFMHFLKGYFLPADKPCWADNRWAIEYDLERWLFVNESASIRHLSSIDGWSLFFRCFGVRCLAMNAFSYFLNDDFLTECYSDILNNTSSREIYEASEYLKSSHPYQQSKSLGQTNCSKFKELISIINAMVELSTEEIKIYLYYDDFFLQIRFYFKLNGNWVDGTTLKSKENYYEKLINLHAYAELIFIEEYLHKILMISCINGKINFSAQPSYSSCYDWRVYSEPDLYKDEDSYFNMLLKWKSNLREITLDLKQFFNDIDSVNWEAFVGPKHYSPEKLIKALKMIATVDIADLSNSIAIELGLLPKLLHNSSACDEILFAVGNNHAGTYYPAATKAVEFISQVAINGNNEISRNVALNTLIDLLHFWPADIGDYKDQSFDDIKTTVNKKIIDLAPQLIALSKWDFENKALILDLLESINEV